MLTDYKTAGCRRKENLTGGFEKTGDVVSWNERGCSSVALQLTEIK
jgi:hypothetical protein